MSIPSMKLTQEDFGILVITIDAYVLSIHMPDIYPEHAVTYVPVLQELRVVFWILAAIGRECDVLLTDPQIIALDEAVQGFLRICERSKRDERRYPRTVEVLNQFHQWLEQMKLPSIGQ